MDSLLDESRVRRARSVADEIDASYAVRERNRRYREFRLEASPDGGAVLCLEDISGIPFVSEIPGVEEYQHRARVRAGDGDLFAAVTPPSPGYEDYNREVLHLGKPDLVIAEPPADNPMAVAVACARGEAFERIREFGHERGGLVIHPYMAIETVWTLAEKLADEGVSTSVLGPPPPVLWIANDKARIAEINDKLFDQPWNVETQVERKPEQMVRQLGKMAARFPRVGLKRTRCASATGNLVFDSSNVTEAEGQVVLRRVRRFLNRTEWKEGEEVLVVEWFDSTHSPSTQTWIPPKEEGLPRLDGVYEQLLKSEERIFVGSKPSTLPEDINESIGRASLAVGVVLQELGYVGRCSFDFVVGGDVDGEWEARMIECNGRWGGTSTPMHLVDRVVEGPRPPYVAMDYVHSELVGATFDDVLDATRERLYRPETGDGRFIFYNVGPLARTGKFDVVSIGETPEDARAGTEEILPKLLGLD